MKKKLDAESAEQEFEINSKKMYDSDESPAKKPKKSKVLTIYSSSEDDDDHKKE